MTRLGSGKRRPFSWNRAPLAAAKALYLGSFATMLVYFSIQLVIEAVTHPEGSEPVRLALTVLAGALGVVLIAAVLAFLILPIWAAGFLLIGLPCWVLLHEFGLTGRLWAALAGAASVAIGALLLGWMLGVLNGWTLVLALLVLPSIGALDALLIHQWVYCSWMSGSDKG